MTGSAGALAFLVVRTSRHRLVRQLGRLKSPRYAIAAAVGLLYFWGIFARPGAASAAPTPTLGTIGGVGLAITVLTWWLGAGVTGALAFQPAEVQLLFPAPLSRRMLIAYKVVRSQLLLLLSCVVWTLLTRTWGVTLDWPFRFLTLWGFFSVLSLHRLGAALVMTPPVLGGRRVAMLLGRALAAVALAALLFAVGPLLIRFGTLGFAGGLHALGTALSTGIAGYVLAPFRLVMAPLYAATPSAWAGAFAVVAGIVAAHLVWVLAMGVKFEEAAAVASADMARRVAAVRELRAGGSAIVPTGKRVRRWLSLAPHGRPAVAIVWKNTIALIRTGMLRTALVIVVLMVGVSYAMTAGDDTGGGPGAAIPFVTLAVMALLLGPRTVRNDLRQDLQTLASVKTWPLSGATVVLAEIVSPTLVLSLFQLAMLVLAYAGLPPAYRAAWGTPATVALWATVPLALLVINAAGVAIQNGLALLFPGWVRLGPDSGGVEAIGQTMVVTIGSFLVVLLSLILPALAAVAAYAVGDGLLGGAALALAGVVGLIVLGVEVGLMVVALGSAFERTDPGAIG